MSDSHYEVTENRIVKLIRAALATSFAVAETLFRSRTRHEGDGAHAQGARDHRPPHSLEEGLKQEQTWECYMPSQQARGGRKKRHPGP